MDQHQDAPAPPDRLEQIGERVEAASDGPRELRPEVERLTPRTRIRILDSGTSVRLEDAEHRQLVILDHPAAPADMRNREAGRIIDGGFQPAFFSPIALRPATLRAIADLIEETSRG